MNILKLAAPDSIGIEILQKESSGLNNRDTQQIGIIRSIGHNIAPTTKYQHHDKVLIKKSDAQMDPMGWLRVSPTQIIRKLGANYGYKSPKGIQ